MITVETSVQEAVDNIDRYLSTSSTSAIMCDLDGTLSLLGNRDPYKPETCDEDIINHPVAQVLELFYKADYNIIFLSGREEIYKAQTKIFLDRAISFNNYLLFMRKEKDYRKDSIIKKELYDDNVSKFFNILFVMDDRNQVVDMWRDECGLTCFQVAKGDF